MCSHERYTKWGFFVAVVVVDILKVVDRGTTPRYEG